jgi:FtsH-binding integral membrane protein
MEKLNKKVMRAQIVDSVDQGLRSFMINVYNYMMIGLLITGLMAFLGATTPALQQILFNVNPAGYLAPSGVTWLLFFVQLGMVFFLSFRIHTLQPTTAQLIFWSYAALMGLTLSSIFLVYTGASLFRVFLITAASFGALSLYGYTTKRDLTGMGSFLLMALFGLILSSVVNMFMKSTAFEFVISVVGVLLFAGLTAYDTQRLKAIYFEGDDSDIASKKAVMGALALYLDFVNMFLYLLRFLGNRK